MKKFILTAIVAAVFGIGAGAMYITENAGLVSAALSELKFERAPGSPKLIGAPPQMHVTQATIDYLKQLMTDNKTIEVQNNGAVQVK